MFIFYNLTFSGEIFSQPLILLNENKQIWIQNQVALISAVPSMRLQFTCVAYPRPLLVVMATSAVHNQQALGVPCGNAFGIRLRKSLDEKRK